MNGTVSSRDKTFKSMGDDHVIMTVEGINLESVHSMASLMMSEFDIGHKCSICGSPRAIITKMSEKETPLCVGCISALATRISEFDDGIMKDVKKNAR